MVYGNVGINILNATLKTTYYTNNTTTNQGKTMTKQKIKIPFTNYCLEMDVGLFLPLVFAIPILVVFGLIAVFGIKYTLWTVGLIVLLEYVKETKVKKIIDENKNNH